MDGVEEEEGEEEFLPALGLERGINEEIFKNSKKKEVL